MKQTFAYRAVTSLAWLLIRLVSRMTVTGREHIPPPDAPVLFAIHHNWVADAIIIGTETLPTGHRPTIMVREDAFRWPVIGWFIRHARMIPVSRFEESGKKAAYDEAVAVLRGGRSLIVAPEGGLSRSFTVLPLRSGVIRMAQETGAPIVPCLQFGAHRHGGVASQKVKPAWRAPVHIAFGPPMVVAPDADVRAETEKLHGILTGMLQLELDAYPHGGAGRWWWPAHLGGTAKSHAAEIARVEERWGAGTAGTELATPTLEPTGTEDVIER